MNFHQAQAIMIDGDEVHMDGTRYRIKDGKLQFFNGTEWQRNIATFDSLNSWEWHKVPAKEYDFMEAAKLCFSGEEFEQVFDIPNHYLKLKISGMSTLITVDRGGEAFGISKFDIDAMWTRVEK